MIRALTQPQRPKQLALSDELDVTPEQRVEQLLREFEQHLTRLVDAEELARATRTTYLNGVRRFVDWLERNGIESVSSEDVQQFKADWIKRGAKPSSVNTWIAGLRSFYGWAVGKGVLPHNPTEGLKSATRKDANKRHKRDALTEQEARALLALELPPRERAIIALMLYTGARTIEVQRARYGDLRAIDGELVLEVQGKGRASDERDVLVLANAKLRDALNGWLNERGATPGPLFTSLSARNMHGEMSLSAIRLIVKNALKQAGINRPGISTHSLRHTAVTTYLRRTKELQGAPDIRGAQMLARHSSVDTTLIYAHELNRVSDAPERLIEYEEVR